MVAERLQPCVKTEQHFYRGMLCLLTKDHLFLRTLRSCSRRAFFNASILAAMKWISSAEQSLITFWIWLSKAIPDALRLSQIDHSTLGLVHWPAARMWSGWFLTLLLCYSPNKSADLSEFCRDVCFLLWRNIAKPAPIITTYPKILIPSATWSNNRYAHKAVKMTWV